MIQWLYDVCYLRTGHCMSLFGMYLWMDKPESSIRYRRFDLAPRRKKSGQLSGLFNTPWIHAACTWIRSINPKSVTVYGFSHDLQILGFVVRRPGFLFLIFGVSCAPFWLLLTVRKLVDFFSIWNPRSTTTFYRSEQVPTDCEDKCIYTCQFQHM